MKFKTLALILALSVMSWAQSATQAPSAPQQSTVATDKAKCSCCDQMAAGGAKEAHACSAHHDMNTKDSKEMASGKDTMSCCKDNCGKDMCSKDKNAASCCGHGCGQDGKSGCSPKKAEKTAKSCCRKELHS
jgi:hypothetical protein